MQTIPRRDMQWLTLGIVSLGMSIGPLDTAVNIAFPAITAAFNIPVPTIQWVVICYVLPYASLLLGCGRMGDIIGHKRVFLLGLGWSAVSLLLCGWAPTFGWFLLFRGCQGIGSALVLSCAPALATLAFDEAERSKVLGIYTMLSAVASTLGPLVGGPLVALWGWSAVYYFRVPIAVLAALLTVVLVRQPVVVLPSQRFDALGAVTLTAAIAGLLLLLNRGNHLGWLSLPMLVLCGGACGCVGFFVYHEARCAEPMVDLRLFRHAAFSMAYLAAVLSNVASFTIMLLIPYYLHTYFQVSAIAGGLLLAMSPLGMMLASPLGGRLLYRASTPRLSLYGLALATGGLLGISQWQPHTATLLVAGLLFLQGFGQGLFQVANMDFIMGSIPRHQQGIAGSLTMLTRTIGVVAGATLGSGIFGFLQPYYTVRLQAAGVSDSALSVQAFMLAFQGAFWGATAVAAVACVLMWSSRYAMLPKVARTPL
jgi:EmrB/QacA subfamily drug resistance transporter